MKNASKNSAWPWAKKQAKANNPGPGSWRPVSTLKAEGPSATLQDKTTGKA